MSESLTHRIVFPFLLFFGKVKRLLLCLFKLRFNGLLVGFSRGLPRILCFRFTAFLYLISFPSLSFLFFLQVKSTMVFHSALRIVLVLCSLIENPCFEDNIIIWIRRAESARRTMSHLTNEQVGIFVSATSTDIFNISLI